MKFFYYKGFWQICRWNIDWKNMGGIVMNTTQLECFVTVAENLNFARAASILHITQPAVTHQIVSLEGELDAKPVSYTHLDVYKRQVHSLLHQGLGAGVDGGGCLIQDQYRRVGHRRPGDGQQLPLSLA